MHDRKIIDIHNIIYSHPCIGSICANKYRVQMVNCNGYRKFYNSEFESES